MNPFPVTRSPDVRIIADPGRVIAKPFLPGEETFPDGQSRIEVVARRILAMTADEVEASLAAVLEGFGHRHRHVEALLEANCERVGRRTDLPSDLSRAHRLLIGAYFTHEYSIEGAAVGNPSMVAAPDQTGVGEGEVRFVLSLRAIGEGHISSVEFRSGVVDSDMAVHLDEPGRFASTGKRVAHSYDKSFFVTKLRDLGALNNIARSIFLSLDERFTMAELEGAIRSLEDTGVEPSVSLETAHLLHWLASSNYRTTFDPTTEVAERVIFPGGPTESQGMEDVRLVRFVGDDGEVVYYGTYTAFDGHKILPQLLETTDFVSFRIVTLSGQCAQNKGMAIFPRKIGGEYVALGRHDNMNNFLMASPDVRLWHETELIQEPERPWELVQLGNCGSPLETEAGWLVITHGVGPFRTYALGAVLLDLDDPARLIGHLREPLLAPSPDEREGYVPNVVYSCGAMIHRDHVVLPYGFADNGAGIATIPLDPLLDALIG